MIKSYLRSLKKSYRLAVISRRLRPKPLYGKGKVTTEYIMNSLQGKSDHDIAFGELIDLIYSDDACRTVVEAYNADSEVLGTIYGHLRHFGAGQDAGGHYVATSSLVYSATLWYLLEHWDGEQFRFDDLDAGRAGNRIAARLVEYFEAGEVGVVS